MKIVGAGITGATIARILTDNGVKVTVYERNEIGGNCTVKVKDGIEIHKHGIHIWHNSDYEVQKFIERNTEFTPIILKAKAFADNTYYSFPPNRETFIQMFGNDWQGRDNLQEAIYHKFFHDYLIKQWGTTKVPQSIIDRIPIRFTFNDRYYNDKWEGILNMPQLFTNLLKGIEIKKEDYLTTKHSGDEGVIFTGPIDEYWNYCYGELSYRSLKFLPVRWPTSDYQGCAMISFPSSDTPYTKSIEYKHLRWIESDYTWVVHEIPIDWKRGLTPYYPMWDNELYKRYSSMKTKTIFAGRLGKYQYINMNEAVKQAMDLSKKILL